MTATPDTIWNVTYTLDGITFRDIVGIPTTDIARVRAGLAKGHGVAARRIEVSAAARFATLDLARAAHYGKDVWVTLGYTGAQSYHLTLEEAQAAQALDSDLVLLRKPASYASV